jgi:aspartyl-tRNA synthetase
MREFLLKHEFIEMHSPKLIATASESGSEVFEVKYFDGKAYLAQSPQFYKQLAISSGLGRVFECAPVFRAEKSHSRKHATEFTGFDLEFSGIESYEDVMQFEEKLLTHALKAVSEKYGEQIKATFGVEVVVPKIPFPKIKLADLYVELEKRYGYTCPESEHGDLTTEAEKLCKQFSKDAYGHEFLFVTDYSAKERAFYHLRKNGVPQGYDLMWKGVEITTGAQREHRYEILKAQANEKGLTKDVEFYLQFFKYGCPPHGGFGLGLDRITMNLLELDSIKESMFIFRGPEKITP